MKFEETPGVSDDVLFPRNAFPMLEALCRESNGKKETIVILNLMRLGLFDQEAAAKGSPEPIEELL